jgi:hypothetical protein
MNSKTKIKMENKKLTIDFDTMRSHCMQIHQEVFELYKVANRIGEDLELPVKSADELRTNEKTKSLDGMGRFAKQLLDNDTVWSKLPERLWINIDIHSGQKKEWIKEEAKKSLFNCYCQLGGKNL